ncbi:hypothetical protein O7608_31145 [Solwaraspora sp. WMMA2056]|uniref:hypothetical protein n=1 Tax=Solwaraspora sp. WMMA2056 TaxID=3015161 RepID=UPI00259BA4AC|nr:hypothetical protein [Solwaraspora sp. WMMA2056]WJK40782.1 hypothetical protein O7608_31145 [Solwaraspora sp. WMMA2056]
MTTPVNGSGNEGRGLLNLTVELSSPQAFSGTPFAIYLHVTNPFDRPIWIQQVTTHLPSAVHAVADQFKGEAKPSSAEDPAASGYLAESLNRLSALQRRLADLVAQPSTPARLEEEQRLRAAATELHSQVQGIREWTAVRHGYDLISVSEDSQVHIEDARLGRAAMYVSGNGQLHIERIGGPRDRDVLLSAPVPASLALQAGSDRVWTLTLTTRKTAFFVPAAYRLNITVLYSFDPPPLDGKQEGQAVHSNTATTEVTIRCALWAVIAGSTTGGILGATARFLQQGGPQQVASGPTSAVGPILLAVILSIAASIFAARRTETPSFISVEDFWGGALVGFLVGYSGTAAFESLTGMHVDSA